MTLSVEDLREHVSTTLGDDALQRLLDAAYETLDDYLGAIDGDYDATQTEFLRSSGDLLRLSRRAMAIDAVVEGTTTLGDDDYRLSPSGSLLIRLGDGTNPRNCWYGRVEVRYIPLVDGAERDRVAIALVKLDLNHNPGSVQETIGSWSEQQSQGSESYATERSAILASYGASALVML
jgi:hypothetical protein